MNAVCVKPMSHKGVGFLFCELEFLLYVKKIPYYIRAMMKESIGAVYIPSSTLLICCPLSGIH